MQSSISDDVGEKNKDEKLEEAYHLAVVLRKSVRERCYYANSCPCSAPGMNNSSVRTFQGRSRHFGLPIGSVSPLRFPFRRRDSKDELPLSSKS